jgi:hypothetical protein
MASSFRLEHVVDRMLTHRFMQLGIGDAGIASSS